MLHMAPRPVLTAPFRLRDIVFLLSKGQFKLSNRSPSGQVVLEGSLGDQQAGVLELSSGERREVPQNRIRLSFHIAQTFDRVARGKSAKICDRGVAWQAPLLTLARTLPAHAPGNCNRSWFMMAIGGLVPFNRQLGNLALDSSSEYKVTYV